MSAVVGEDAVRARIGELARAGEVVRVDAADAAYRRELAEIKRLIERRRGDPAFRERLRVDPRGAARSLGLEVDPVGLEPLWDRGVAGRTAVAGLPRAALRFMAFARELAADLERLRVGPAADARYDAWRRRQRRRLELELPPASARRMPHVPYAIELSQGCSVGCWFCGVSAPRLEQVFRRSDANAALFGDVVDALVGVVGELAGHGMCYWASDPLDNPDYEQYLLDARRRTGRLPPTSTALALRDPARTRGLLALARAHGGRFDRFSVLSLGQLDRLHREFSAEELLHVEVTSQNREGLAPKARVGRARERNDERTVEDTSACVSGFLVSMVRRTVQLVSPCLPSARRPLGLIVFAEAGFADAAGLRGALEQMLCEHMPVELRGPEPLAFRDDLAFEALPDGFRVVGRGAPRRFTGGPLLARLGRVVDAGAATVDDVLAAEADESCADVLHLLGRMLDAGVLDLRRGA